MRERRVVQASYLRAYGVPVLTLCAGLLIGWGITWQFYPPSGLVQDSGLRITGQYKFVSPLLLCSSSASDNSAVYQSLASAINSIIDSARASGAASDVSVYFRDFQGQGLNIGGNTQYAPASLLKVPLMIAYYKATESDPNALDRRFTITGADDANTNEVFRSPNDLPPGTYSVAELITSMIEHSDNNAERLLANNIDPTLLGQVYSDLGLTVNPGGNGAAQDITAKQYSYFFRILYNATYLTPENSEKALEMLVHNDFTSGLEAPLPQSVDVAQKFGERTVQGTSGKIYDRELHDCGIVYATPRPYFVCVMTRGNDFAQLERIIQNISQTVYGQVK